MPQSTVRDHKMVEELLKAIQSAPGTSGVPKHIVAADALVHVLAHVIEGAPDVNSEQEIVAVAKHLKIRLQSEIEELRAKAQAA